MNLNPIAGNCWAEKWDNYSWWGMLHICMYIYPPCYCAVYSYECVCISILILLYVYVYLSCLHNVCIASSDTMVKPNEAFQWWLVVLQTLWLAELNSITWGCLQGWFFESSRRLLHLHVPSHCDIMSKPPLACSYYAVFRNTATFFSQTSSSLCFYCMSKPTILHVAFPSVSLSIHDLVLLYTPSFIGDKEDTSLWTFTFWLNSTTTFKLAV